MNNPFRHMTIATLPYNSDGEAGSMIYVFGHECAYSEFEAALQSAVEAWLATPAAQEWAESNFTETGVDWMDALSEMPEDFLTERQIRRLDRDVGTMVLSDEKIFELPESA